MIDTIEVGELLHKLGRILARIEEQNKQLAERVTVLEAQHAARIGTMTASRWGGDSEPGVITPEPVGP